MHSLSVLLYNLAIKVYHIGILISSLYDTRAQKWLKGRKDIFRVIEQALKPDENRIWIHCASLGEFEQGRPVIEELKKSTGSRKQFKIVLTFFSPSGYEIRKNYDGADYVFYLPLDTKRNARRFIELVRPDLAIFVKYEFWYHHINTLQLRSIPIILISAIFRKRHLFFKWYGKAFRKLLRSYHTIYVQDEGSVKMLETIGVTSAILASDTRIDRVYHIVKNVERYPIVESFKQDKKMVIAGSTWQEEEKMICRLITSDNKINGLVKFVIAPHQIGEDHIRDLARNIKDGFIRYSEANGSNVEDSRVMIIDNVGMLSYLYQYGFAAVIGGGFGKGIHNILEPAAFGLPILFGPNYKKFQEARDLVSDGGAFTFKSYDEFKASLLELINNEDHYKSASSKCRDYVESGRGGTKVIVEKIEEVLASNH